MNYLAIRTENGKGVYYFNSNGEKSRILSKFPGTSTRVFTEDMKKAACEWAGVEDIVSEETNKWATTKNSSLHTQNQSHIQSQNTIQEKEKEEKIETNEEVMKYLVENYNSNKETEENNTIENKENIVPNTNIEKKNKHKNKKDTNNIEKEIEDDDISFEEIKPNKNNEKIQEIKKGNNEEVERVKVKEEVKTKKENKNAIFIENKNKEKVEKVEKVEKTNEKEINNNNNVSNDGFTIKHTLTDFEQILEIYKRMGSCMLKIEMISGESYCIIPETFWYLSKDNRKFRKDEKIVPTNLLTCNHLREVIIDDAKFFKETKTGPKNPMFGEIVSTDMLNFIPKTKYLAFGNLIYISNGNFYEFIEEIDIETNRPYLFAKRNNLLEKINITINANDIKKISIIDNKQKIETKEFLNLLKKAQKEKELEKLQKIQSKQ